MPIDWTSEQETEYRTAAKRVFEFHFGRYKEKPKVEEAAPEPPAPALRPDPAPLPVTPSPASKQARYPKGALRVSYGLNAKARQAKEETSSGTE